MPSYVPKKNETVAVYFDRNQRDGKIIHDSLPIFGTVIDKKNGRTKFDDGETININYKEKGLDWMSESEIKKNVAKSLVKISKTRSSGKKKSTRRKKKQTGIRKNKKQTGGFKLSFLNFIGIFNKTKKKLGGSSSQPVLNNVGSSKQIGG